LPTADWRLPT